MLSLPFINADSFILKKDILIENMEIETLSLNSFRKISNNTNIEPVITPAPNLNLTLTNNTNNNTNNILNIIENKIDYMLPEYAIALLTLGGLVILTISYPFFIKLRDNIRLKKRINEDNIKRNKENSQKEIKTKTENASDDNEKEIKTKTENISDDNEKEIEVLEI